MLIREMILSVASVFVWQSEQGKAMGDERKAHFANLFANMREHANASAGDMANGANLLGVELKRNGFKPNSIKVRRSEFLRIWSNIGHVNEDCTSWKGALADIRKATTGEGLIMLEDMVTLVEQIESLQVKLNEKYQDWRELTGEPEAGDIFSDEQQTTATPERQLRAA